MRKKLGVGINAKCQICLGSFELDGPQQSFVFPLLERGQSFIMIECRSCGSTTQYVNAIDTASVVAATVNTPCPDSQCGGWVDLIEDQSPPFWGCGECGSVWYKDPNS